MILNIERFIRAERPYWEELERALDIESDPRDVTAAQRFYYLYRRAATDLVKLNTLATSAEVLNYVETLVARAYAEIHARGGSATQFRPLRWFLQGFPRAVRAHHRALLTSIALTLAGCFFGAGAVAFDGEAKALVLPFSHLQGTPSDRVADEETKQSKEDADPMEGNQPTFAAMLMQNNIRVSFLAAALGMTYAIGTVVLLFYNGVILGAVAFDYVSDGQTVFLIGWLLPHGATEIPSIILAGQAGLMLGGALLGYEGAAPLRERLRTLAPDLGHILLGIAVLLVWAGLVEAFFSQYHAPIVPYSVKIAFGTVELGLLAYFLLVGGRSPKIEAPRD